MQLIKDLCKGCGLCVRQCPFDAIEIVEKVVQFKDNCTNCGACAQACKFDAIKKENMNPISTDHELTAYEGIWVFAEQRQGILSEVALELLGEAYELAAQRETYVAAVLIGEGITNQAKELVAYGADRVYVVDHPELFAYRTETYTTILANLVDQYHPEALLLGATHIGRDLAPRLARRLGTGLTADCTGLAIDPEEKILLQTRPAFGGNLMATIACPHHRPQMSTVRPGVMVKREPNHDRQGEIILGSYEIPPQAIRTKVLNFIEAAKAAINLEEAEIILAGGRGVGGAVGFDQLENFAKQLGATIGASRGAVDAGWVSHNYQVGQTGKTVRPKLYIACGISGAIQHVAGMQSADCIVAINTDPNAPIFKIADYGIVGDVHEVLPLIADELKAV